MATYTIIWQDEGEYVFLDRGIDEVTGNLRCDLNIEYFLGKDETKALLRYADLKFADIEKSNLELLIDGRDYRDVPCGLDIMARLQPMLEYAKKTKEDRFAKAKEAAANAAVEKARKIVERKRQEYLKEFERLKKSLGK